MRNKNQNRSTPKVKDGKVQKKNNHSFTPNYWNTKQSEVQIVEEKPGKGYKHFLKKRDIIEFLKLIPNWDKLSEDLNSIVLEQGESDYFGAYYNRGIICITAWEKDKDIVLEKSIYNEIKIVLDKLGVESKEENGKYNCEFNIDQIKGFQLLYILMHELGHHYDRLKTKNKVRCARGEPFAEEFAFLSVDQIWSKYQEKFNVVF